MPQFAKVIHGSVVGFEDFPEQPACKVIDGLPTIRPVVDIPKPVFDSKTHRLEYFVSVFDDRVERGWNAVALTPEELQARIPLAVSMRQARLALLGAGLLSQVNSALAAMGGVEGDAARIEWEYATEVSRTSPLVANLTAALGLTNSQLDELFTAASTL